MIESTDTTIRKRSLAEEMAVRLQEQIAQGRFEVGGKLPTESELMKIFGVGRSTVREAVKINYFEDRDLIASQAALYREKLG